MAFFKSHFFKYGIPFIGTVVIGSFGLREFTTLRYTYRRNEKLDRKQLEKEGITMKSEEEMSLQSIYDRHKDEGNINEWENVRGPRPWEEGSGDEIKKIREKRFQEGKTRINPSPS